MDILLAIAIMALGAVVLGAALGFASIKFKVEGDPLVEKIEAILPQTQCGQCGYPGCKPYAEAIANGEEINKCPPGGTEGVQRLADLLGREVKPLDAEQTTASGLVIPDTAKEKPQEGEVVAVGPGRFNEDGDERLPMDVSVGDTVIYSKYGGTEVKFGGDEFLILSARDVLAIVG